MTLLSWRPDDACGLATPSQVQIAYRPSCHLQLGGARFRGVLERVDAHTWAVGLLGPRCLARLRQSAEFTLSLACDASKGRPPGRAGLRVVGFHVDAAARRLLFRPRNSLEVGAKPPRLTHAVTALVRAPCLFQRAIEARVAAVSPFEIVLRLTDPDGFLVPSALLRITIQRPWGGQFRFRVRVAARSEEGDLSLVVVRPEGGGAVRSASWLAVCESPGFGIRHLRLHGLSARAVGRYLSVTRSHTAADFKNVLSLRRAANQFFGRQTDDDAEAAWSDRLEANSLNILVWVGGKPVGTGRLVFNDGDRSLSEIEASTALPDWVWAERFIEISRVAIEPDYRSAGVMMAIFREVGRIALEKRCRWLVLDAIDKLVPFYEKIGATRLPITKKHPFSDETVTVMVVDLKRAIMAVDRRLLYWAVVFGPVVRHHIKIFGMQYIEHLLERDGRVGFRIKRLLSNVVPHHSV